MNAIPKTVAAPSQFYFAAPPFALACPRCRGILEVLVSRARCAECHTEYDCVNGIWRLLLPEREKYFAPFREQYQRTRAQERWGADNENYYRALPRVPRDDPHRAMWRIREKNFRRVIAWIGAATSLRVLDVGAGNGWLANQLAARGHRVAAVDLRDDARDGLGARRNYFFAFECYQAEFERLPFAPAQFDLVIFNASLHYAASLAETLQEASRILAPIGKILLVDSPFYSHSITQSPNRPNYFLTFDQLNRTARELNLNIEIIFADAEWHKRARRKIIARKLGREPAHFPIYTLQSPPVP